MKGKKLLGSIVMLAILLCLVFGQTASYATKTESFWVNLAKYRTNNTPNTSYAIGYPTSGANAGDYVWDLISYASQGATSSTNKDLYCVKGGVGYTWNNNEDTKVEYKTGYNLKTERSGISGLSTRSENYSNIAGSNYNSILWITDNLYVPGSGEGKSTTADRTALLKKAGIDYTDEDSDFYNLPNDLRITDDDIEVVQQIAIWYFTNNDLYHRENMDSTFIKNSNLTDYINIANYKQGTHEGEVRLAQMNLLYKYLLEKDITDKNSSKYDSSTNELGAPVTITIDTDKLQIVDGKAGPIKVTKNNDLPYSLDFAVNGTTITDLSKFVDSNGNVIDKDTASEIYVKVGQTTDIDLEVTTNYKTTDSTLWVPETSNVEQPIIEVKKVPHNPKVNFKTNESSFDLSLRKFITSINGVAVESRAPQVDVTPLKNGQTTAKYTHSKEPLKVKNGDLVEYTIRVYNEGEIDGYAEQLSDNILNNLGLEFVEENETNTTYRWTKSGDKVITDYLSKEQGTDNLLTSFNKTTGTALDYKDVKIVFKVIAENSCKDKLVNIAQISKAKDKDGNDMNNTGDDRDSTPAIDKYNYPNNGYNTENHEDDIDYEPVQLRTFDLALRKFISAVSSDETIDPEDYLTGDQSREPVIPGAGEQQWRTDEPTTLIKNHSKNPLTVKSGDYVLYTIRVYNEGEIDGYASLIRDNIPEGLTFVATDAEFNGIWTIQSDGSITTDWLARDNERNKVGGEVDEDLAKTNGLLKALKKNADGSVNVSTTDPKNPDYKDVQVLLKVTEPDTSTRTLTNRAQVSGATDENGNPMNNTGDDVDSTPDNGYSHNEDDEDFEPVILKFFDLSLRKFITSVDGNALTDTGDEDGTYTRAPVVDTTSLVEGTTATYNHTKEPLAVRKGSTVVYTIRVYNEGTTDGYASKIIDFLPPELEFIPAGTGEGQSKINQDNGWALVEGSEGRRVETNKLADTKLNARVENQNPSNPYTLSCQSLQIECKIKDTVVPDQKITNLAEITEYKDENKQVINPDRDSKSNSLTDGDASTGTLPTDEELPTYKDDEISKAYVPGQQDDDDFEKIIIAKKVDLALTKFITAISTDEKIEDGEYLTKDKTSKDAGSATNPYDRQTAVNTNPLKEGEHDAIYTQVKTPLVVGGNSYVLYNIRVYNEGEVDVYAGEVTDYLPEYLTFVDGEFNRQYGWTADGQTVKTSILSSRSGVDKILKAFDIENDDGAGSGLDYKDLPILCRVNSEAPTGRELINTAEITKYEDKDGNELQKDIDSIPNNKKNKNDKTREEDDDDYEVVLIENVDLALTKFITAISSDEKIEDGEYLTKDKTGNNAGSATNPYDRQTAVNTNPLKEGGHDAVYTQVKDPLNVNRESYVLYNIRVYNEGKVDVYAGEVADYLPENLEFVDGEFNKAYGWTANGQTVKTSILSFENGTDKMLKAFDSETDDGAGSGLDYKDLPILCKVSSKTPSAKELINTAEITKYEDKDGNNLPNDIDSIPDNKKNKNDKTREEDDDDYEVIIVEEFDLSLLKFVSQVIVTEDGKTTTSNTGNTGNKDTDIIPKVEINRKKLNSTTVKFLYTIQITNEGDIAGYAKEITDYVPEGLEFKQADNPNWYTRGEGVIATRALENTLLKPGESAPVTVVFTWINDANNLGLKRNTAEISEDYNDKHVPDRDSIPDNRKEGEDDIDYADVLLSIKTGKAVTYILLGGSVLLVLAGGIFLIKKYVL